MYERTAMPSAVLAARQYPVVTLLGPRQSGKTTLAKVIGQGRPYANLEAPDTRRAAQDDGRGFLARFPEGAVIDEVQRVPELTSWIQADVDARPGDHGRWLLTGSHQPHLREVLSQSLAGRTALITLLPLALEELATAPQGRWDLDTLLVAGGYPRLHHEGIAPHHFHADYAATYLERDVRQLITVRHLDPFQRFLALAAGRNTQLMNRTALAAEVGVDATTITAWLGVLEASFVAQPLTPWFANLGKRLVKHPKLVFHDVGVVAYHLGLTQASQVRTHPLRGALMEGFLISEVRKFLAHRRVAARLHFYRDSNGHEVDLLVEAAGQLLAIEIKAGMTLADDWFPPLRRFAALPNLRVSGQILVSAMPEDHVQRDIRCCPWWRLPVHLHRWLTNVGALTAHDPPPDVTALDRAFGPVPLT